MRIYIFRLAAIVGAAVASVSLYAHANAPIANAGELTQVSVESAGQVNVFHLFDVEDALRGSNPMTIASESGTSANVRLEGDTLLLSINGFDYRLPLAMLPRKAEAPVLAGAEQVTIPGREYRMTFAREGGSEDVVKVQRRFTGAID